MAIEDGLRGFGSFFTDTIIFDISWLISIALVAVTLFLISKDPNDWKTLALPVTVMWQIVGITPSFIWYILVAIMFILNIFSLSQIGRTIDVIRQKAPSLTTEAQKVKREVQKHTQKIAKGELLRRTAGNLKRKVKIKVGERTDHEGKKVPIYEEFFVRGEEELRKLIRKGK